MIATAKKPDKKSVKKTAKAKAPKAAKSAKPKKAQKVKPSKKTEDELLRQLKEIEEAELECQAAAVQMHRTKVEAKAAKDFYDNRVFHLRELVRASVNDANRPLFQTQMNGSETNGNGEPKKPEAWRDIPIQDIACGPVIDKKLVDAKFETVGKIADHTKAGGKLTDIPGIGPGAAEIITERMIQFFSKHPEYIDEPKAEEVDKQPASSGIDSVTISAPGHEPVTLKGDSLERFTEKPAGADEEDADDE